MAIEKEQHVCKLHTCRCITNTSKQDTYFFNVRPVKLLWIKPFSLNKENLTSIKRQSRHWIKLWCIRSCLLQDHYNLWKILTRYCSEDIITKVTFTKLLTVFPRTFCLVTILLQEWIFTYQDNFQINVLVSIIFEKFWENIIWPMKAKSRIYTKTLFRETLQGVYIKIDNSVYFGRCPNRFRKNNYSTGENFLGQYFLSGKIFLTLPEFCYFSPTKIFTSIWKR